MPLSRSHRRLLALALGAGLLGILLRWPPPPASAPRPQGSPASGAQAHPAQPPLIRRIAYRLRLRNTRAEPLSGGRLEVFAPLERTPTQETRALQASLPYTLIADRVGNRSLRFELPTLAPYATRIIRIEAEIAVGGPARAVPVRDADRAATALIPWHLPEIRALAARLRGAAAAETLRHIYRWVSTHIEDPGYVRADRGALETLRARRGDCTGQAYLSAALARALGLPARVLGGYVYDGRPGLRAQDYHNWTEVWLGDRWVLLDAQAHRLDEQAERYLALRILDTPAPDQDPALQARFAYRGAGLEVAMN